MAATANSYRVLVVDDEEPVRQFVERVLRQPGYDTATAGDGLEALAAVETKGPFDIVVTDVAMPRMSGEQLAQRLRKADPSTKILYLTGYSDRLFQERVLLSDGEAFVEKPVSVQGLLEAVSLLLVGHIPPARAARVRVPGARVRLPNAMADVVNLSTTGLLIHTAASVQVGTTLPLVIDLPLEAVPVTGRVASCQPADGTEGPDGRRLFAVAIGFVSPSAEAQRAIQSACRTAASVAR
jgi:CheY-like chemotaxis protein